MRKHRVTITKIYFVTLYVDILGVLYTYIYMLLMYKHIQGLSVFLRCMFLSLVDTLLGQSA